MYYVLHEVPKKCSFDPRVTRLVGVMGDLFDAPEYGKTFMMFPNRPDAQQLCVGPQMRVLGVDDSVEFYRNCRSSGFQSVAFWCDGHVHLNLLDEIISNLEGVEV